VGGSRGRSGNAGATGQASEERSGAGRVPVISAPAFAGRQQERAALGRALAGQSALVLVEGEAGIGKSRLVREFLAGDDGQQQHSMVAACPPFRRPCTLSPMVDAIRQTTGSPRQLKLSGLAGALRPLFPEWSADLPPVPDPAADATAARHRLFRALDELLACLGVTVLVVEDVHWADEATLEFLLFLGSQQQPRRSLVLTYRPEDVPGDSLLLRLSSRMPGGASCKSARTRRTRSSRSASPCRSTRRRRGARSPAR
jgi:hypothetical protein